LGAVAVRHFFFLKIVDNGSVNRGKKEEKLRDNLLTHLDPVFLCHVILSPFSPSPLFREKKKMVHSHSTQEPKNVCLVSNNYLFYTNFQAHKLTYTLLYIMYIFFVFFLIVVTIKSAGTFKLGLHDNMEGGACTHNLTKLCISKAHWLYNQNTRTEREKIKRELSDIYTYNHTQDAPKTTQTMKKIPKNSKQIRKKIIHMYICQIIT
jgi:hypothetical protein